jgi:drug/metabolite transporter (DMT)-like permease
MPSIHVACAVWLALVLRIPVAWVYPALIFLGSVILGWHYASDGIVAAFGALVCWALAGRYSDFLLMIPALRRRTREVGSCGTVSPEGATD